MNIEGQIQALEQRVNDLIVDEPDVFLVEVRIKPTNNVKVFLDADHGMNIDSLIRYNRKLYRVLEESSLFPNGDFSLEVSSPGLDEPLKSFRQYQKNTGRFVEITTADGAKREGKLIAVTEQELVLEEQKGKGRKLEMYSTSFHFGDQTTRVQIKF
jgi:ribosome maturation factor RimP